jgi:hypothetical protein
MKRRNGVARLWPVAAGLLALTAALTGPAQSDNTALRVPITTADGVELDGTYYRSLKAGRDCPCIIMVHKYGADRSKADWVSLAGELQNTGFNVLTFDLRGHGGSTQISNPAVFWKIAFNSRGIHMGGPKKTTIEYKDFKPGYFPFIVNDLAAARRFLEQKNDAGECNIHNLFIIGAQEGAGLGFLFTAAEYARTYRIGQKTLQSYGTLYNAGEDIGAGVWLSLTAQPGTPAGAPTFRYVNWVKSHPTLRDKTYMSFIFGDKDNRAKSDSDAVFRTITGPGTGVDNKHKLDDLHPVAGTDLAGAALLGQPAMHIGEYVRDYLKKVLTDRRAKAWTEVQPEVNLLNLVPVQNFGISLP